MRTIQFEAQKEAIYDEAAGYCSTHEVAPATYEEEDALTVMRNMVKRQAEHRRYAE